METRIQCRTAIGQVAECLPSAAAPVSCVRFAAANRHRFTVKIFACVSVFACAGNIRAFHDSRFGVLLSASRLGAIRNSANSVFRRRRSIDGSTPAPPAPSRRGTALPPLDACRRCLDNFRGGGPAAGRAAGAQLSSGTGASPPASPQRLGPRLEARPCAVCQSPPAL